MAHSYAFFLLLLVVHQRLTARLREHARVGEKRVSLATSWIEPTSNESSDRLMKKILTFWSSLAWVRPLYLIEINALI